MTLSNRITIGFFAALSVLSQAAASERTYKVLLQDNPAGTQTIESKDDGSYVADYSFNDRGRGDHIIAKWKLNAAGVPIQYEGRGNDYMKAAIEERFEIKNGKATWKNRTEQGEKTIT